MIDILTYETIDHAQWESLYNNSPTSSFFQSKICYDAYTGLSFLEPFVYAVSENNQLTALVCGYLIADGGRIKQFFSRRAIVPGALLLDENVSDKAIYTLLKTLQQNLTEKGAIYIELRNYTNFTPYRVSITHSGFNYHQHLNIHVTTPDVSTCFSKLNDTRQRQIKHSLKAGAICELSFHEEDLKAFYNILIKLYRRKINKPLFPYEFFRKLHQQSFTRFFAVKKNDEVIGGIFCVQSNKVVYEWFICGDNNKIKKIYPSVLATWKAIEYAAANGFQYFDFMGAGNRNESYGVREFKSKFGGELIEQGRFLYLCKPKLYKFSKKILNLTKKILSK